MKQLVLMCGAALVCAAATQAQGQRPAELKKLEKLVGNWEGKGSFYPVPTPADAQGMPWTSHSSTRWVLNGHFLLEDMRVDFPPETGMGALVFRTLHGWDPQRKTIFTHTVGNNGVGTRGEIHWLDADTIITVSHGIEQGEAYVERTISKLAEGTFEMSRATGGGELAVYVEGELKKSDKEFSIFDEDANVAFAPPAPEAGLLQRMAGTYSMSGRVALPGTEPAPIDATLELETIFGGHASFVHVKPGGGRPELFGHMYWDAENDCYGYFKATAEGQYVAYQARPVGRDQLLFTAAYTQDGTPTVERIQLGLAPDGGLASLAADVLSGNAPIARVMEGRYTRAGGARTIEAKFTPGSCCAKAADAGSECKHPCCVEASQKGEVCARCNI